MCVSIVLLMQDFESLRVGSVDARISDMSMYYVWTPALNGSSALQHFECDIECVQNGIMVDGSATNVRSH